MKINADTISNLDSVEAVHYLSYVFSFSLEEWFFYIQGHYSNPGITKANIPQFSDFNVATKTVVAHLRKVGDYGPGYEKIGQYLLGDGKKKAAYLKYGENHAKMAKELGLVLIEREKPAKVYLTELGKAYLQLDDTQKNAYIARHILLIPVVNKICYSSEALDILKLLKEYLSDSTASRRLSNINTIMKIARDYYGQVISREKFPNL